MEDDKAVNCQMTLFERVVNYKQKNGIGELVRSIPSFIYRRSIRKILPDNGYVLRNGIEAEQKKVFDSYLPRRFHLMSSNKPNFEQGIISLHHEYTEPGDDVVIIAGGYGVSAVKTAEIIRPGGTITIYEGSKEQLDILQDVLQRHDVNDICNTTFGIVGKEHFTYGGKQTPESIPVSNIQDCDVLELDCEGSEISILENLEISPRVIILEIHPHRFDKPPERVLELIDKLGYEIVAKRGHIGRELNNEEFKQLIDFDWSPNNKRISSGAKHPPVIAAKPKESV